MSSTTPTRSTIVQNSRLLDLPGELRNHIYTLAIEDANFTPPSGRRPLFLIPAKENEAQTTPRATEDWSLLRRTYLGLTQTCAQLRSEVLPLYRENVKLVSCVDISASVPYTETFVLPYQGLGPSASPLTVRFTLRKSERVPVEPIISLCGRVPGLRLRHWANFVVPALQDERFGILAMTNAQINPTFAAYYRRCITKMEVGVIEGTISRIRLSIYLKPEYQEGWMSLPRVLADYRSRTYDWMERSGLSTDMWGSYFDIQICR